MNEIAERVHQQLSARSAVLWLLESPTGEASVAPELRARLDKRGLVLPANALHLKEPKALFRKVQQAYELKDPELDWDFIGEQAGDILESLAKVIAGDRGEAGVSIARKISKIFSAFRKKTATAPTPVDETEQLSLWLGSLSEKLPVALLVDQVDQLEGRDPLSWRIVEDVARTPSKYPGLAIVGVLRTDTMEGGRFLRQVESWIGNGFARRIATKTTVSQPAAEALFQGWSIDEEIVLYTIAKLQAVLGLVEHQLVKDVLSEEKVSVDDVLGRLQIHLAMEGEPTTLRIKEPALADSIAKRMQRPEKKFHMESVQRSAQKALSDRAAKQSLEAAQREAKVQLPERESSGAPPETEVAPTPEEADKSVAKVGVTTEAVQEGEAVLALREAAAQTRRAASQLAEDFAITLVEVGDHDGAVRAFAQAARQRFKSLDDESDLVRAFQGDTLLREAKRWSADMTRVSVVGAGYLSLVEVTAQTMRQRFDLALPRARALTDEALSLGDADLTAVALELENEALLGSGDRRRLRTRMIELLPRVPNDVLANVLDELWLPDELEEQAARVGKSVRDSAARKSERRDDLLTSKAPDAVYAWVYDGDKEPWRRAVEEAVKLDALALLIEQNVVAALDGAAVDEDHEIVDRAVSLFDEAIASASMHAGAESGRIVAQLALDVAELRHELLDWRDEQDLDDDLSAIVQRKLDTVLAPLGLARRLEGARAAAPGDMLVALDIQLAELSGTPTPGIDAALTYASNISLVAHARALGDAIELMHRRENDAEAERLARLGVEMFERVAAGLPGDDVAAFAYSIYAGMPPDSKDERTWHQRARKLEKQWSDGIDVDDAGALADRLEKTLHASGQLGVDQSPVLRAAVPRLSRAQELLTQGEQEKAREELIAATAILRTEPELWLGVGDDVLEIYLGVAQPGEKLKVLEESLELCERTLQWARWLELALDAVKAAVTVNDKTALTSLVMRRLERTTTFGDVPLARRTAQRCAVGHAEERDREEPERRASRSSHRGLPACSSDTSRPDRRRHARPMAGPRRRDRRDRRP